MNKLLRPLIYYGQGEYVSKPDILWIKVQHNLLQMLFTSRCFSFALRILKHNKEDCKNKILLIGFYAFNKSFSFRLNCFAD